MRHVARGSFSPPTGLVSHTEWHALERVCRPTSLGRMAPLGAEEKLQRSSPCMDLGQGTACMRCRGSPHHDTMSNFWWVSLRLRLTLRIAAEFSPAAAVAATAWFLGRRPLPQPATVGGQRQCHAAVGHSPYRIAALVARGKREHICRSPAARDSTAKLLFGLFLPPRVGRGRWQAALDGSPPGVTTQWLPDKADPSKGANHVGKGTDGRQWPPLQRKRRTQRERGRRRMTFLSWEGHCPVGRG